MENDFLFAEHTKCASAHRYSIYIFEHTWIQMSNCIINRANTSACFVAYSPARTLYILRLRCRWRCWCLKIRQEIICRHTHTHTHTCVAWLEKWKTWKRWASTQNLIYYVDAVNWCGREHFSCLLAGVSFVCYLIMHAVAQPVPPPHSAQHWFIYVQFIKRHF